MHGPLHVMLQNNKNFLHVKVSRSLIDGPPIKIVRPRASMDYDSRIRQIVWSHILSIVFLWTDSQIRPGRVGFSKCITGFGFKSDHHRAPSQSHPAPSALAPRSSSSLWNRLVRSSPSTARWPAKASSPTRPLSRFCSAALSRRFQCRPCHLLPNLYIDSTRNRCSAECLREMW